MEHVLVPPLLARPPAAAPPTASPVTSPPIPGSLLQAGGGAILLALAAAVGAPSAATALRILPWVLSVVVLPWGLTAPSLLVARHFFGQVAPPSVVGAALARGLAASGRLAAGLSPLVLFLALTTPRGEAALSAAVAWTVLRGVGTSARALDRLGSDTEVAPPALPASVTSRAWALLTVLLALRLGSRFLLHGWVDLEVWP